jgi:[ribosomal protein S5]-alanine N-acetyltransferase
MALERRPEAHPHAPAGTGGLMPMSNLTRPPSSLGLPRPGSCVIVRALRPSDLPQFHRYRADPLLARYQGWSAMSAEQSLDFLTAMSAVVALAPGEWIQLAMAAPETDLLVGDIGLRLDEDGRSAEIGFTLAREHQGQGLATRAVAIAVEAVFGSTAVGTIRGITDARNSASIRLLERIGFEKVSERSADFKGEACTEQVFERARGVAE